MRHRNPCSNDEYGHYSDKFAAVKCVASSLDCYDNTISQSLVSNGGIMPHYSGGGRCGERPNVSQVF